MITLEHGPHGTYLVENDDGRDLLVQTDWDFPGLAGTFGWDKYLEARAYCTHESTDGTVQCDRCGATPADFINEAIRFLDDHVGESAEDPGYFEAAQ